VNFEHKLKKMRASFRDIADLDYSIHISVKNKYIYFNNPKCGCSFTKALLNLSEAVASGVKSNYLSLGDIHDRAKGLLLQPSQLGWQNFFELLDNPEIRKVTFVREPISRLCSAYMNKLSEPGVEHRVILEEKLRSIGRPSQISSFDDFIGALAIDELLKFDEHWRPQHLQICFDFVKFDFIGHFETLENDIVRLQKLLFERELTDVIELARALGKQAGSNASRTRRELTPDQTSKIRDIYSRDFEIFYPG